jgi:uncharacterized protein
MTVLQRAPGLYYEAVPPAAAPSALRSDIAGFVGRMRRGPLGVPTRVTGARECQGIFGGPTPHAQGDAPLALQGYFDNGGDVAYVVRVGSFPGGAADAGIARGVWDLTRRSPGALPWANWDPKAAGFGAAAFDIMATSPGPWANGLRVAPRYRSQGASGHAEVDLVVSAAGETTEYLIGLDPTGLVETVAAQSALVRLQPRAAAVAGTGGGPRLLRWDDVVLGGGAAPPVAKADYEQALVALGDIGEVALLALPDLVNDLPPTDAREIQANAAIQAEQLHDRLVLIDLPESDLDSGATVAWADEIRSAIGQAAQPGGASNGSPWRAAAAYCPWLSVQDPLGGTAAPMRTIAPCGHVAGLVSLLDRQRGAHYTPANATLEDALDVSIGFGLAERGAINDAGVNLLRCSPNQGIQVWGARTLHTDPRWRYVAHRRLIHRLVRAIRRVAEPLVFESNGPALWLAFTRAATTVLLEAYRAGGLQGARPEEAFRVVCDAGNNPPEQIDLGQVACDIQLAPAVPMEFITLRVRVAEQGKLEVFES